MSVHRRVDPGAGSGGGSGVESGVGVGAGAGAGVGAGAGAGAGAGGVVVDVGGWGAEANANANTNANAEHGGEDGVAAASSSRRFAWAWVAVAVFVVATLGWATVVARLPPAVARNASVDIPVATVPVSAPAGALPDPGAGHTGSPPTTGGLARREPDPTWLASAAVATAIPERALQAYARASIEITAEQPACGLGWNTLAAIGDIESGHGTHGGAVLGADGYSTPRIVGPALDGDGVGAIADTDGGAWDGDTTWDHAVGPMQFIPSTWAKWGADGNGDGISDPNQIDDAALAAARYLCASGSVDSTDRWRAAVLSYNHLDSYVDDVAAVASRYAAETAGLG